MTDWIADFPDLVALPADIRTTLVERSRMVRIPQGTLIFGPGKMPEGMVLLLEGVVRVQQVAENGREIILYRVHDHESCVLTTACLLADEEYHAEGVAETDIVAVAIPRAVFDEMIASSADFRRFVFATYSRRITDLFLVIEEIAFRRIDLRLARKLLELGGTERSLHRTHQQLATELGTAREVVSRQLQEFQRRGWIAVSRGRIDILDPAALGSFSESE